MVVPTRFRIPMLRSQRIGGTQAEADAAIGEIEALMARREGPPLVWIWDDIYVIAQPAVWTWLDHFLDRMADLVRIVMVGRSRPPLPLAGRLARGELLEITEEDLRFDRDETARLLAQRPTSALSTAEPADGPALEHLYRRTRGWVTGLKLLAAGARGHDGEADRPELFDYLVEEVLEQLPVDLQQFLADVSVQDCIRWGRDIRIKPALPATATRRTAGRRPPWRRGSVHRLELLQQGRQDSDTVGWMGTERAMTLHDCFAAMT